MVIALSNASDLNIINLVCWWYSFLSHQNLKHWNQIMPLMPKCFLNFDSLPSLKVTCEKGCHSHVVRNCYFRSGWLKTQVAQKMTRPLNVSNRIGLVLWTRPITVATQIAFVKSLPIFTRLLWKCIELRYVKQADKQKSPIDQNKIQDIAKYWS